MYEDTSEQRTIFCGNLSSKVTEEVLYELFLQAAPLERVKVPIDKEGRPSSYAFITFKHAESVSYAICLLNGISLYDRKLNLKPRSTSQSSNQKAAASSVAVNIQRPNLGEMVLTGQTLVNNAGKRNYDYSPVTRRERHFDKQDHPKDWHDYRGGRQDYRSRNARHENDYRGNHSNIPYNRRRLRLT